MFTKFEHFAATSLMGSPEEAPPRQDGHLHFDRDWEKMAFGVAIALSKQGHYEWEEFRQTLIETISEWEATHDLDDPEWDYYQCWVAALEKVVVKSGVLQPGELEAQMAQLLNCKSGEEHISFEADLEEMTSRGNRAAYEAVLAEVPDIDPEHNDE